MVLDRCMEYYCQICQICSWFQRCIPLRPLRLKTFENTSRVPCSVSYIHTCFITYITYLSRNHTYNTSGAHSSFFSFFFLFHRNSLFFFFLFLFLFLHRCILLSSVPSSHTIPSDFDLVLSLPVIHQSCFSPFFRISQLFIPSVAKQSITCQSYISFTTTSSTAAGSPT